MKKFIDISNEIKKSLSDYNSKDYLSLIERNLIKLESFDQILWNKSKIIYINIRYKWNN